MRTVCRKEEFCQVYPSVLRYRQGGQWCYKFPREVFNSQANLTVLKLTSHALYTTPQNSRIFFVLMAFHSDINTDCIYRTYVREQACCTLCYKGYANCKV
jgi:hypothetical protein